MTEKKQESSGLSDDELRALWLKFRREYPELYRRYLDAAYQATATEDELRANDGGIHMLIASEFPELESYPGRHRVYADMIGYLLAFDCFRESSASPEISRNR